MSGKRWLGVEAAAARLKASYAADQPDHSAGIMACVRPNDPGRFVVEGGTPEEEVHLTLAYFGKVTDEEWTDSARQQIAEVISAEIAADREPIHGEITAVTTFELAGEDEPPLVLLVDAPGLGEMRAALVKSVNSALGSDQEIKSNHDFMPHITLCYGANDSEEAFAEGLIGEKVTFDSVELVWGTESSVWPLGSNRSDAISDSEAENGLRFEDTNAPQFAEPGAQEGEMPYEIVEKHPECSAGDPYAVVKSDDGELMGCHPSRQDAEEQMAALYQAEEGKEEDSIEASADPLAIVIGDEPTRDERLAAIDEFVAPKNGAGGGGASDDEDEEDDSESEDEVEIEVEVKDSESDDEESDDEEDMDAEGSAEFQAVAIHHTPTSDGPWDGPANEARAKSGESEDYYRNIFAWQDPEGDPETKAAWRFIHHEVSEDGTPGAANLRACSTGIGVLNGGRGGTTIPAADREGVYRHLAAHLADAEKEVPELTSLEGGEAMEAESTAEFKAVPSHDTATIDPPTFTEWDGDEAAKRARSGETPDYYNKIYAWVDSNGDPTNKTSYKFPHHVVSESGEPGAAVVWAVHSSIAVIDDSTIPTSDYQGVYNHLARHLRDAGVEDIPELGEDVASIDEVRAAIATMRARFHAMAAKAVQEASVSKSDITASDDLALVGEVVRRWFESVAKSEAKAVESDAAFAADDEAAISDCPCHDGVLEDGATHTEGCPFAKCDDEMAEEAPEGEEMPPEDDEVVVGDFKRGDYEWEGVLIVEGLPSGDGRMIDEGALTWRELPVPLMLQTINAGGHDGAVIAGSIHEIERVGHEIVGRGYFDSGEAGQEAKRLLSEGTMRGVSADIDSVVAELRDESGADVAMEDVLFGDPGNVMEVLTEGRIMGATMTPFPAFQEAHLKVIGKDDVDEDMVLVASGSKADGEVWRFTSPYPLVGRGGESYKVESLVASGGTVTELPVIPVHPPLAWFAAEDPELDPNMPFTVFPNGRIYGLVARWGTCHIGFSDRCVQVPRPHDGYANFRCGHVLTAEGTLVSTGPIYADTVHPSLKMSASDAQAFYAHTGCALGDVVLYEGEFGILAAGAVKSDAPIEAVNRLRAAGVSPDWRTIDRNLEIVGLLSVNVSGFPVSTALVAAASEIGGIVPTVGGEPKWEVDRGEFTSLVAAGSLMPCTNCGSHSIDNGTALALLEMLNDHAIKIAELSEVVRPYRMERLVSRLTELGIGSDRSDS